MSELIYRTGDLFDDLKHIKMNTVVAHVVNDAGLFGAGFAADVARHYPEVRKQYLADYRQYYLGSVQFVEVGLMGYFALTFANLFAQEGVRSRTNPQPLSYEHLRDTLDELAFELSLDDERVAVWMPKIGSGLGGGDWSVIEQIIKDTLVANDVRTVIYSLPEVSRD